MKTLHGLFNLVINHYLGFSNLHLVKIYNYNKVGFLNTFPPQAGFASRVDSQTKRMPSGLKSMWSFLHFFFPTAIRISNNIRGFFCVVPKLMGYFGLYEEF